eukprot:CAMPEP_0171330598 /NCGR_PEP_ID=MMETSP0878-20121228/2120_1 /TAXON_ID=67004 /ORGANISM="Thalassiosira weissflogii, Strain CCMP1336" /LENGTH=558 /DNA_ID=CAMNT_0011830939 /DNA_START=82 /DNA_END=1755 /DNA_ORIENTATION=-
MNTTRSVENDIISNSKTPKVQKQTLRGHRKQVLCLAHSSERLSRCPPAKRIDEQAKIHSSCASTTGYIDNSEACHNPTLLLSGSEDGTARLWDLRMKRASYCMMIPRDKRGGVPEVTSVAFHPCALQGNEYEDKGPDAILGNSQNCTIYVCTNRSVYGYDLRHHSFASVKSENAKTTVNPIVKSPHFDLSSFFECTDEINQLSFSFPRYDSVESNNKLFLSAADDSGEVHILQCVPEKYTEMANSNCTQSKPRILYHADPESYAITSCAVFRPRNNETIMASGGTDCMIKLWDINRPKKPTYSVQVKPGTQSENTTQLCNPPYIHSLSWSPSGRLLAAGVGDGSCIVLRGEGKRLVELGRLGSDAGGHGSAVAAVCFPGFGLKKSVIDCLNVPSKSVLNGEAEDRLMISAGNDGNLLIWDLGRDMVGDGAVDPAMIFNGLSSPSKATNTDESKGLDIDTVGLEKSSNEMESLRISTQNRNKRKKSSKGKNNRKGHSTPSFEIDDIPIDFAPSSPKVLFHIAHGQKPNWITCSRSSDKSFPSSLFVADTTCDISVYTLP